MRTAGTPTVSSAATSAGVTARTTEIDVRFNHEGDLANKRNKTFQSIHERGQTSNWPS